MNLVIYPVLIYCLDMNKTSDDIFFMNKALLEAKKALKINEVPIGAIIVKDNKIIARGYNKREKTNSPLAHAEMIAIKKASKKLNSWRMPGCKIYVTLEPCLMCSGAIMWSRFDEVIFGASDVKGGAIVSTYRVFDNENINHHPKITSGILKEQCSQIIKDFFVRRRLENKHKPL